MSDIIISVVIPTYNSSTFIIKTLDCLRMQTFKDFETVIINDGSKDKTEAVVSKYIIFNPDLNMRLINQENRGIAAARNRGIIEAKGRYIAFLDHDDIWRPIKLKNCYEAIHKDPHIDLVCHNELLRDASGRVVRTLSYGPYTPDMFRRLLFRGNYLSTSATVVKREVLLNEGLFREYPEFSTVEDYDLWLRLSKKYKFSFLQEVLGEYVINERNASLNFERHYNNLIHMLKLNFSEYEQKTTTDYFLINFRISRTYFILAKHFFRKNNLNAALKYISKSFSSFSDTRNKI